MQKVVFNSFLSRLSGISFKITYPDGTGKIFGDGEPKFTLKLNRPLSTLRLAKDPLLELGEAYMEETIDIEGDLSDIIKWIYSNWLALSQQHTAHPPGKLLPRVNKTSTIRRQKKDVQHHYDLGNDFFALWLDETMSYSCAYFESPKDSLKDAQLQKIDHVLRKLQLKPGESLLDIGSGWGQLIIRAARQYNVKAIGITLSEEQFLKTKETVAESGLENSVSVRLMDYRELADSKQAFDKIASVGMLEHVGKENLPIYLESVNKLLRPGGLALLHSITDISEQPVNSWMSKYIFPGGYIPSLRELVWLLPEYDFHVLDIESLRIHYALTLDQWAKNFQANTDRIRQERGERFVRMWSLYLLSCAQAFRTTGLDVHQILCSKCLNNNLPLTRRYLYQS